VGGPAPSSWPRSGREVVPDGEPDPVAIPIYARTRDSIKAHLSIVFAAIAVGHWIEETTGWSLKKFVKTARRYRTYELQVGKHTIKGAEPLPDDLAAVLETIKTRAAGHYSDQTRVTPHPPMPLRQSVLGSREYNHQSVVASR
jgi:hypothetical protein